METFYGIAIPFIGTSLGAACVFFMKNSLRHHVERALNGFAAGVMVAASIWSLLLPAIEQSSALGMLSFFPALIGFWMGILFLLVLEHSIPHLYEKSNVADSSTSPLHRTTIMILAVTLHNIPEGMAVGAVYAGYLSGNKNIPEVAIISLPLHASGMSKRKAFTGGVLSGIVEPIGAILTILAASILIPVLPYLLSFAAGAMLYVVVEELVPEMTEGKPAHLGTLFFAIGFSIMMVLDVALG